MGSALRQSSVVAGVLSVIVACAAAALITAQADNPQIGFWNMNMTNSKFSTGTGFKRATSRIEAVDGGVRLSLLKTPYASPNRFCDRRKAQAEATREKRRDVVSPPRARPAPRGAGNARLSRAPTNPWSVSLEC